MIVPLIVTILVESFIVIGYSFWRRKPVRPILLTSICANFVTQSFLWVVLNIFFQHYLLVLLVAEILIWTIESILLYSVAANRLYITEAILLSLSMNLVSFALGWFLPV